MKELSIEQKARAYDDLLIRLQKAKVDNDVCDDRYCCVIDVIVPELKESEDERMRNVAINACKYMIDNFENSTKQYEDAIAWLEKQGEQKPAWKPTEEQIEALEHLLETIRRHEYSYFHEEKFLSLHSLLEQLKKL